MGEPRMVYVTRYWQTDGIRVYRRDDGMPPAPGGRAWVRAANGPKLVERADLVDTLERAQEIVEDKALSLLATIQYGDCASRRRKQIEKLRSIVKDGAKVVEVRA